MLSSPKRSALVSALIHAGAILLIVTLAASKHSVLTELLPVRKTPIYLPLHIRTFRPGGGGGQRSPSPPSKRHLPKTAPRVFTPPIMRAVETRPKLEMPPEALGAPDVSAVQFQIGSLTGALGRASGGPGLGGIGRSHGPGAGDGDGPGVNGGPGGGGSGPGRKSATKPELIKYNDPEYSDEARKAKVQGTVELSIEVSASGQVTNIRVVRGIGMGLDERAIEAVRGWRFRAGTIDGKPVATTALVEVNFRLL